VKEPSLLGKDVAELTAVVKSGRPYQTEVIYGLLTTTLDFRCFRSLRADCANLDDVLTRDIQLNLQTYIRGLFSGAGHPLPPTSTQARLLDCVNVIASEKPEYLKVLRRAFRESHPLRKLNQFNESIRLMLSALTRKFPSSEELGADQIVPAIITHFFLAKPPYIVSNYVFVHDLCLSIQDATIQTYTMYPFSALTKMVEKLKGFDKEKYFRITIPKQ
jgi:hypothetical protein